MPAATEEEKDRIEAHSVNSIPDPTYGGQLQDRSIQGFAAEGKLKIDYKERPVKLADGEVVHSARAELLARRPRLRSDQPRHHDLARASRRR